MKFFVYVLQNETSQKFYTGHTSDLSARLARHNKFLPSKPTAYTNRQKGIWSLVYSEELPTRAEAMRREKELKSYRGRQFVKQKLSARSSVGRAAAF